MYFAVQFTGRAKTCGISGFVFSNRVSQLSMAATFCQDVHESRDRLRYRRQENKMLEPFFRNEAQKVEEDGLGAARR